MTFLLRIWLAERRRHLPFLLIGALILKAAAPVAAQTESGEVPKTGSDASTSPFRGRDGSLDVSSWLLDRKGFLPVPIVITEPAIGTGGGIGLVFFSESLRDTEERAGASKRKVPPDLYIAAGFGTEKGSHGGGVGSIVSFDEDRWRYRGLLGGTSLNLDFYGIGGGIFNNAPQVHYTLKGWSTFQQLSRRINDSNYFVGARWLYLDLDSSLNFDQSPNAAVERMSRRSFPGGGKNYRNSGLGILVSHDSRDNFFTPTSGWAGEIVGTFYDPDWGSDTRFASYRAHVFAYQPFRLAERLLVAGLRLDLRAASGDTPFFQQPFIDMRGIPAGRYQDERAAVSELELRYNLTHRWSAVGFVGAGRAWGKRDGFADVSSVVSKGVGFRYLLAKRLGLYVGLDYAWGPEEGVPYIQVGSAWR